MRIDIDDPALCLRLFKSNRDAGLMLFAGLLVRMRRDLPAHSSALTF